MHRFPNGRSRSSTAACTGTSTRCTPRSSPGSRPPPRRPRPAARASPASAIDSWAVDYGLLDDAGDAARRRRSLPRRPAPTPRSTGSTNSSIRPRALRHHRAAVPAVQHDLPARRRAGAGTGAARRCSSRTCSGSWLTGAAPHRGHQRLHHRALRRRRGGVGHGAPRPRWACPADLFPPLIEPGETVGTAAPRSSRHAGTARNHRRWSPSARTTPPRPSSPSARRSAGAGCYGFAYISCGTWSLVGVELSRTRC